jgi:hypothetical protein
MAPDDPEILCSHKREFEQKSAFVNNSAGYRHQVPEESASWPLRYTFLDLNVKQGMKGVLQ